jgi:hypothetical protein
MPDKQPKEIAMSKITRRQFLTTAAVAISGAALSLARRGSGALAQGVELTPQAYLPYVSTSSSGKRHIYVARNGTPVSNVESVIDLAGGIQQFVGRDDAVVLKPNGQWPNQGYTHTQSIKALIDVILNRPGGFNGEIILTEHVHRDPAETLAERYCWNMSPGNRQRNWADMNYLELVGDYHQRGYPNVTAAPMCDSGGASEWAAASGPGDLPAGKHGWVRLPAYTAANGNRYHPSYAILRSSYSGNLVDLHNGVWSSGGYTGQRVRLILLPTLNNHSSLDSEDYAGPTSAVKCHIGFIEGTSLHSVGYNSGDADAVGEAVGHLITQVVSPTFYLTSAEWTGYGGRTNSSAAQTRTVGLCADPATLDYWMCKYVMLPCRPSQTFMNPDQDSNLRRTLQGCMRHGVGTLDESQMAVHQVSLG